MNDGIDRPQIKAREAIALVSGRELRVRLRSKGFLIMLAVSTAIFTAFPLIMHAIQTGPSTQRVAVVQQDSDLTEPLHKAAAQLGQLITVSTVADQQTGAAQVNSGKVDALVVPGARGLQVTVDRTLSAPLRTLFQVVDQQTVLDAQIIKAGADPAEVAQAVGSTQIQVRTLRPSDPANGQHLTIAIAAGLLMYMSLMTVGQVVAQGIVEEKSSRVVELLLATLRPWQLLAGKVLGTGLLGLMQITIPGTFGVGMGLATGQLRISLSSSVGTLAWAVIWYLAGFLVYSLVFAAIGATVSRQEDLGGMTMPVLLPLITAWVIGISVIPSNPRNGLVTWFSMIPLFSPVLMPMRYAMGAASLWQVLVALALTLALGILLLRFGGRVYRNSVLRSGARVPLREALKAA